MRRPPPLSKLASFPVTTLVGVAAAAVSLASARGRSVDALVMDVRAFHGQPWRLLASILPHADLFHLGFNLYWLWVLGTAVEGTLGALAMASCVAFFGVGSVAAEYALFGSAVGLSGVGYGLVAMVAALGRRDRRFADVVDKRTFQLFAGWFVFCIAMTVAKVWRVANVAHGFGALLGLIVGVGVARRGRAAVGAAALGVGALATALLGATVLRPRINLSREVGSDAALLGLIALRENRRDDAVRWFDMAVRLNPRNGEWWYDLAILHFGGRNDAATTAALERALALEPNTLHIREFAARHEFMLGLRDLAADNNPEALRHLRRSVALGPPEPAALYDLGVAELRAGNDRAAGEAFERARREDPAGFGATTPGGDSSRADGGAAATDAARGD